MITTTHRGPEHLTICDQTTLGWTALRVEEEKGPELCVTVSELRRAREVYRDLPHPRFPKCECARIQVATVSRELATVKLQRQAAAKAGDLAAADDLIGQERILMDERRELRLAWAKQHDSRGAIAQ